MFNQSKPKTNVKSLFGGPVKERKKSEACEWHENLERVWKASSLKIVLFFAKRSRTSLQWAPGHAPGPYAVKFALRWQLKLRLTVRLPAPRTHELYNFLVKRYVWLGMRMHANYVLYHHVFFVEIFFRNKKNMLVKYRFSASCAKAWPPV